MLLRVTLGTVLTFVAIVAVSFGLLLIIPSGVMYRFDEENARDFSLSAANAELLGDGLGAEEWKRTAHEYSIIAQRSYMCAVTALWLYSLWILTGCFLVLTKLICRKRKLPNYLKILHMFSSVYLIILGFGSMIAMVFYMIIIFLANLD